MPVLFDGLVHVHYGFMYLTPDGEEDADLDDSRAGQINGLLGAAEPHCLSMVTATHTGDVAVRVEWHPAEPLLTAEFTEAWEEIVEAPFDAAGAGYTLSAFDDSFPVTLGGTGTHLARLAAWGMDRPDEISAEIDAAIDAGTMTEACRALERDLPRPSPARHTRSSPRGSKPSRTSSAARRPRLSTITGSELGTLASRSTLVRTYQPELRPALGWLVPTVARRRLDRSGTVIVVATAVGLVMRGVHFTRPNALFGEGSDDAVYFGAAVRLVHGALPYHDYVLVHPPLITVLLAPFALLSQLVGTGIAFALARLATVVVGAASVALTGLLLRRFGVSAVVVGCTVVALHGSAVASSETVLLEPYLDVLVLAGLLVFFDGTAIANPRRQFCGSLLVGLACATKIFAIVPAVVLMVVAVLYPAQGCRRQDQLRRVAAGLATGFAVPVLPFFAAAPGQFLRDVFVSQLQRHTPDTPTSVRAASLLGGGADQNWPGPVVLVGGAALVIAVVVAYRWWLGHHRMDAFTVFAAGSAVLVAAMFFVPDTYDAHYGGFFAPFLGLVLARPATDLAAAELSASAWRAPRPSAALAATGITAMLVVGAGAPITGVTHAPFPVSRIDKAIPSGACVLTDNTSLTLEINRFTSVAGCPQLIDPYGTALVYANGVVDSRAAHDARPLKAYWEHDLARAQFVLLTRDRLSRLPFGSIVPILHRDFHYVWLRDPQLILWQRNTVTPRPAPHRRPGRRD